MTGYTDTYYDLYDLTVAQMLKPWNYTALIYIAFDAPTSASPTWVNVTAFVDLTAPITITRGRGDGLSDINAGTCTLTVDNSDGRWSPSNPAGPWYGSLRKGCWLRVDVLPPSGTVSTRFVGFIQQLPTSWSGLYPSVQISASDRMALLTNAIPFLDSIASQTLAAYGNSAINAVLPLHEPAGALYASDISGNGTTLTVAATGGVTAGQMLTWSNTQGPGFDGVQAPTFAPVGYESSSGLYRTGSYLKGNIGPLGAVMEIGCWVQTAFQYSSPGASGNPVWCLFDPDNQINIVLGINNDGQLDVSQGQMSAAGFPTVLNFGWDFEPYNGYPLGRIVNDNRWHQIIVRLQSTGSSSTKVNGPRSASVTLIVDGYEIGTHVGGVNPSADFGMPTTMSQFILGGALSWDGDAVYGRIGLFTGNISDLTVHSWSTSISSHADWYTPSLIGRSGIQESAAERVMRIASYTGLATPTTTVALPGDGTLVTVQTAGTNSLMNLPVSAHQCAPQAIAGRAAMDVMREAAHTEYMPLFVDRQGRITLQPSTLRQNPTAAFTINAADLEPNTGWADDFQYFTNQTTITPSGQGSVTVNINGAASQALNGLYSQSLSTATLNAAESISLGAAVNLAGANPPPRLAPLACEAATLATQTGYGNVWYDAVLAAEISTTVQVTNWPVGTPTGSGSSGSYCIEGYTETLTPGQHVFAWNTSPVQGPTYQADSMILGVIDTPGLALAY